MKKLILFYPVLLLAMEGKAQIASSVSVQDTRNVNEVPIQFDKTVRFDFKARETVSVPGSGTFSGMMTFAPWGDASGDKSHQLNFNNGGLYYRQGAIGANWETWRKIIMEDVDGRVRTDREVSITKGGGSLFLNAGSLDHAYMAFYASSQNPGLRSGWFGYGAAGNPHITLANERAGGAILLATNGGNVGIDATATEKLTVGGGIKAKKVKVTISEWPDYVFSPAYTLPSLQTIEQYIARHQHLPDIPSAKEVEADGLDVGEMNKKLLQKVEELTLHLIEQQKTIQSQQAAIGQLSTELQSIKQQLKH